MPNTRKLSPEGEKRAACRYALPAIEIVIGDERFRAIDWSMSGALLYGICEVVGARVRGEMGVPGSTDTIPFAATVMRADLEAGNCAICFEDCRTEAIDFPAHSCAAALQ